MLNDLRTKSNIIFILHSCRFVHNICGNNLKSDLGIKRTETLNHLTKIYDSYTYAVPFCKRMFNIGATRTERDQLFRRNIR